MIYRVNKIEDLRTLESELTTEAVVIIDKVLPYDCSGVMFKTTKGWSKIFLDATQLNTDATINGSLTLTEGITIGTNLTGIGATDIDLGFTDTFTIDGNSSGALNVIGATDIDLGFSDNLNIERTDGTSKGKITFDDFSTDVPSIEMFQAVGFEHGYVSMRKNEITEEVFGNLFARNTNTGQSTTVDVRSDFVEINGLSTAPSSSMTLKVGPFSIQLNNIPTYADNAAAVLDSYPVDGVYKTATGELRIVV